MTRWLLICVSLGPFVGKVMLIEVRRAMVEDIPGVEPAKAPTFLRLRLEKYRDRGDGNDYLIMRREGIPEASDSVRADTSRIL